MQIGSQKMWFPFLVVFQLGHNTTNLDILNIQVHRMKSPYTQQRLKRRPIWTHILALLKAERQMMIHTWAGLQTLDLGLSHLGFIQTQWLWKAKHPTHMITGINQGLSNHGENLNIGDIPILFVKTHHPHKLESMPSKPLDTTSLIIPYSKFAENTTYSDHYRKWRVQDSVRNVKEVRWDQKWKNL